jgi:hypothetical protein
MSLSKLAFFGVVFAASAALGALAHAADKPVCGKVGVIRTTQSATDYNQAQLYASVEINGVTFKNVRVEIAQIAETAKAAGQRVCATERETTTEAADQGYPSTRRELELTFEDDSRDTR